MMTVHMAITDGRHGFINKSVERDTVDVQMATAAIETTRATYAARRSKDFTSPPTYSFTSI
jgi:hypothetical protein